MKFRYLDGLRGWAALVVVINHYLYMTLPFAIMGSGPRHGMGEGWIHNTPLNLLVSGEFSVSIFFVLSGIVLSAKFFRTKAESAVAASATKRYLRLALPVLGSILIACLLLKLGLFRNQEAAAITGSGWWQPIWNFAGSWREALYQGSYGALFSQNNTYNPVLWTMQVEFLGSFLVFMTLALFGKQRNRWVMYAFLTFIFWHGFYLAFLLGVILSDLYFNRHELFETLGRGLWIPVTLISLLVASYPVGTTAGTLFAHWTLPGWGEELHVLVHVLAAAGLIMGIMSARPLQRLLQARLSLFLGRISFSMYLLHFLVLGTYGSYLFIHLSSDLGYRTSVAVAFFPILAITVAAAYLYAKYVDERAIAFSGWVYRRWFGQASSDEAKQRADLPLIFNPVSKFIPSIMKWSRSNLRPGRS